MDMRDPYKALGLDPKATEAEIKRAYRRLAREYHPDRNPGDKAKEKRFKDISAAYEILGDPKKRSHFDNAADGGNIPMGDLSEIFAQMFGGRSGGSPFGGRAGGTPFGANPFGTANPFGGFGGMGGFRVDSSGSGRARPRAEARPTAPPAERVVTAADGSRLTQRGDNIYSDLRISFDKAMTGTVAEVPTLSGTAKVRVPPGTSSGQKLRLKGKGLKASNPSAKASHGDHFVTVQIDVPKVESGASSKHLAKLVQSLMKEKI